MAEAYGWQWPLTDADILERVVALNTARAAEEAKGIIRCLRPDYQKPLFAGENQSEFSAEVGAGLSRDDADSESSSRRKSQRKASSLKPIAAAKAAWPKPLAERVRAVETALAAEEKPAAAADLAQRFTRAKPADLAEILDTLVTLGRARPGDAPGTFVR
ncbi:MAG: hypothetical protein ABIV50_09065 [Opitutus sp.]